MFLGQQSSTKKIAANIVFVHLDADIQERIRKDPCSFQEIAKSARNTTDD